LAKWQSQYLFLFLFLFSFIFFYFLIIIFLFFFFSFLINGHAERGKRDVYCDKQVEEVVTVLNCMLKGL